MVCAITQELPLEPVTAEDGNIYERSAIEEWLRKQQKSPLTNTPMGTRLLPALQVKAMIETMVKSGAIGGDKADSWRVRLKEERQATELRARAEAGDTSAMHEVARNFTEGKHGFFRDQVQAFNWFERAARGGYVRVIRALAVCYRYGSPFGIAKNHSLSVALMTEAATLGDFRACEGLGDAYAWGSCGLPTSIEHARRWYERACKIMENLPRNLSEKETKVLERMKTWLLTRQTASGWWVAAQPHA